MDIPMLSHDALERFINSCQGGQMGQLAVGERNRRLFSGDATLAALQSAVNQLVSAAPQDHDVLIIMGDLAVHKITFIKPHTFVFEGIDQDGHNAGVVLHYTQVNVRVVYPPKDGPSRRITGFAPI